MSATEKRSISLPVQHAAYIDRLVASGAYASVSEVVRAGLRALQERDQAVERWLEDDVVSVYDAMRANPDRGLTADGVFDDLRARHTAKARGKR